MWQCNKDKWKPSKKRCESKNKPASGANYCRTHGCAICYKNKIGGKKKRGIRIKNRIWVCNEKCKSEWMKKENEWKSKEQLELKNEQFQKDRQLERKIINTSNEFYEKIKHSLDQIIEIKHKFIDKKYPLLFDFINNVHQLINNVPSSLVDNTEKTQWKSIYDSVAGSSRLPIISSDEESFLCGLAQKYKNADDEQRERERERENQERIDEQNRRNAEAERVRKEQLRLLIINEIQSELAGASLSENELPSVYHNYQTLNLDELQNLKDSFLEDIRNHQAKKTVLDLLNRVDSCADNDLQSFIQDLENLSSPSATPAQQKAAANYQQQINSTLNRLRSRWNNLSEEAKLNSYWNKAIQDYSNWLKEAENLTLGSDEPFANFKQNIKNYRTAEAIQSHAQSALKYILIKFQRVVKNQLGEEQEPNEYSEIDKARDFAAVKAAYHSIRQKRTRKPTPTPSPSPQPGPGTPPPQGPSLPPPNLPDKSPRSPTPENPPQAL